MCIDERHTFYLKQKLVYSFLKINLICVNFIYYFYELFSFSFAL